MHLAVSQCVDVGVSHARLHTLTWGLWSGPRVQKKKGHIGAALARAAWQSVAGANCRCRSCGCVGAGAHVDSCRLGLLLAAPVDKGLGHPGGAVVPVQNCRCPGVGARTQVADAVCTQTMPGGLGNAVMGPAMLQRCSVHLAWNGWPYVCMAGHSTCH